ncbi:uncharacterized protein LOC135099383 isoform X1 [Scylla paramamosain]|uniref:uncharacterized protein LOC135099383 isoform X1 n=1 Tax=Scylla paramamosain TaxID=85552 RepID=UPI003083D5C9
MSLSSSSSAPPTPPRPPHPRHPGCHPHSPTHPGPHQHPHAARHLHHHPASPHPQAQEGPPAKTQAPGPPSSHGSCPTAPLIRPLALPHACPQGGVPTSLAAPGGAPIGGAPVSPGGHDSNDDEPPVLHPPAPEPRPTHHQPHHHIALASCGLHPAHDTSIHAGRDLTPSMYPPVEPRWGAPRQPHRVAQSMLPAPPPPPLHCPTPRPLEPPALPTPCYPLSVTLSPGRRSLPPDRRASPERGRSPPSRSPRYSPRHSHSRGLRSPCRSPSPRGEVYPYERRGWGCAAREWEALTTTITAPRQSREIGRARAMGTLSPAAVFDDDLRIMSEAEMFSTGFHKGGEQRVSPPSPLPSPKTLDAKSVGTLPAVSQLMMMMPPPPPA